MQAVYSLLERGRTAIWVTWFAEYMSWFAFIALILYSVRAAMGQLGWLTKTRVDSALQPPPHEPPQEQQPIWQTSQDRRGMVRGGSAVFSSAPSFGDTESTSRLHTETDSSLQSKGNETLLRMDSSLVKDEVYDTSPPDSHHASRTRYAVTETGQRLRSKLKDSVTRARKLVQPFLHIETEIDAHSEGSDEDVQSPLLVHQICAQNRRRAMVNTLIRNDLRDTDKAQLQSTLKVHACTWNVDQNPPPPFFDHHFLVWLLGRELAEKVTHTRKDHRPTRPSQSSSHSDGDGPSNTDEAHSGDSSPSYRSNVISSLFKRGTQIRRSRDHTRGYARSRHLVSANMRSSSSSSSSSWSSSFVSHAAPTGERGANEGNARGHNTDHSQRHPGRDHINGNSSNNDENDGHAVTLERDTNGTRTHEVAPAPLAALSKRPRTASQADWPPCLHDFPDLFVVTLQEVDMGKVALVRESTSSREHWTEAIVRALHHATHGRVLYRKLKVIQLVGLILVVLVQTRHEPYITHIRVSLTRTGTMRVLGNKGSVCVRATIYGKRFLFIGAHFVAHKYNEQLRTRNYHAAMRDIRFDLPFGTDDESEVLSTFIHAEMALGQLSSTHSGERGVWRRLRILKNMVHRHSYDRECRALDQHDYVFFLGDLNSRLHSLSGETIRGLAMRRKFDYLLCRDELRQGMISGDIFDGFQEPHIEFAPTYKFDRHSDVYDSSDKKRDPAWCDRILFRVLPLMHDETIEPALHDYAELAGEGVRYGEETSSFITQLPSERADVANATAAEATKTSRPGGGTRMRWRVHSRQGYSNEDEADRCNKNNDGSISSRSKSRENSSVWSKDSDGKGGSEKRERRGKSSGSSRPDEPANAAEVMTSGAASPPSYDGAQANVVMCDVSSSAPVPINSAAGTDSVGRIARVNSGVIANTGESNSDADGSRNSHTTDSMMMSGIREATFHAARRLCDARELHFRLPMIPNTVNVLEYFCVDGMKQSDHRAVGARFEVNVMAIPLKVALEIEQRIDEQFGKETGESAGVTTRSSSTTSSARERPE